MLLQIGDLVEIKTHQNSRASRVNPENSPVSGNFIGSSYFAPELQGKIGIVTSLSRSADDDVMWVAPFATIVLETGMSVVIHESELRRILDDKKPSSISPKADK